MRFATKFLDLLQKITVYLAEAFLLIMVALMFAEVIARFFGGSIIMYGQTILRGLVAWSVFILIGSVSRENSHIRIGFFAEKLLGERAPRIWSILEDIVTLPILIFLIWAAWLWVDFYIAQGLKETLFSITGLRYPSWIPVIIVPIGLGIAAIFYIERIVKQLASLRSSRRGRGGVESDRGAEEDAIDASSVGGSYID
ncbi:TRAP transporter small permease [Chloroflexota bacterium]